MEKTIVRVTKLETGERLWCALEVRLTDLEEGKQRFSICGSRGRIVSSKEAKAEALDNWTSYFEDLPEEMKRLGRRTASGAAKYVLKTDGDLHGLDVYRIDGKNVYLLESCGQIRDDLKNFFPEVVPYFEYHLNDMRMSNDGEEFTYLPLPPEVLAWFHGLDALKAA